jgi:hypothetical protein
LQTIEISQFPEFPAEKTKTDANSSRSYLKGRRTSRDIIENNTRYEYERMAFARSFSNSQSPTKSRNRLTSSRKKSKLQIERISLLKRFFMDYIKDVKLLEKLKIRLSARFDFTVSDLISLLRGHLGLSEHGIV